MADWSGVSCRRTLACGVKNEKQDGIKLPSSRTHQS